jgi:pentatricopeptide repeat protein
VALDKKAFNALLGACAQSDQPERTEELFAEMQAAGVDPDAKSFQALVGAYRKMGDEAKTVQAEQDMLAAGFTPAVPGGNSAAHPWMPGQGTL